MDSRQIKWRSVKSHCIVCSFLAAALAPQIASAALIDGKTSADVQLNEPSNNSQNNGSRASINTRYIPTTPNNEVVALRFDLAGVNRSLITSASLNLTSFRDATGNRAIHAFGVADGAMGVDTTPGWTDDNWVETMVVYFTIPGLAYDANAATHDETGTDLDAISFAAAVKGALFAFSDPAITTFRTQISRCISGLTVSVVCPQ